jgi:hypothetical protein
LIRAKNGLLILHVDLGNLTTTVQTKLAAAVGGGQTLNDTATRQTTVGGTLARGAVGIVSTATQLAIRPITFSLNPERDNQIAVTENPTFGDTADVYRPYIQFLNLRSPKQSIYTSVSKTVDFDKIDSIRSWDARTPPPKDTYIQGTLKKWKGDNRYYYIPKSYRQAYFDLCCSLMWRGGPSKNAQQTLNSLNKGVKNLGNKSQQILNNQFLNSP